MKSVTTDFLAALRGSHGAVFRVTATASPQYGTSPTGTVIPLIGGSVRLDGTADERGSLDITVDGDWPVNHQFNTLAPFGQELFVERGIAGVSPSGPEYVALGYFRIETVEQDDAPNSPIRITGRDRMAAVIEARLITPVTFAAGTTFQSLFSTLIGQVYPGAPILIEQTSVAFSTLREAATVERDRYEFLRDMATSRGQIMYFNEAGSLVIKPVPDPTVPVWDVNTGVDGVLVNARRQLTRTGVYNAVVAEGTEIETGTTTPPPRGYVVNNDLSSATYFGGPYGQVPRFYASPLLYTNDQCTTAAQSILDQVTGLPYSLDLTAIPNPALEPYDPVSVSFTELTEEFVLAALMNGVSGSYWSTPDTASLDIVGDIDIRAKVRPKDWTPPSQETLVSKYNTTGNQASYRFALRTTGLLELRWSTNGSTLVTSASTVATGFTDNTTHWVRATLTVSTGTTRFYTSENGEDWTQLGANVVTGATSIFSGTAPALIGSWGAGTTENFTGFVYRAEIRNGIAGAIVAAPYFDSFHDDDYPTGVYPTSFVDGTGKTWTMSGTADLFPTGDLAILGDTEVHVIDTLTIPLSSDQPMSANTRATVEFSIS